MKYLLGHLWACAGHVAAGRAVAAEAAAQEEVVIGGRIAVRLQGGLPGDEVVRQGVDRWSARRAGGALCLAGVQSSVAEHLSDGGTPAGDIADREATPPGSAYRGRTGRKPRRRRGARAGGTPIRALEHHEANTLDREGAAPTMRDRRGACPTQTGGRLRCRHDARPAASRGGAASSDSRWSRVATSRPRQPTRERTRALSMPSLGCGAHARLAHCLHPSLEDVCGFELDGRYPPMAYPPSALTDATSIKDGRPRSRVLISELEHGGYESAARCLSDDLDALVVHLLPDEGQELDSRRVLAVLQWGRWRAEAC